MIYPIKSVEAFNFKVAPQKILPINDKFNSTFDVTSKINKFFNQLCISNIIRNKRNHITKANISSRYILFITVAVLITIACFYGRKLMSYFDEPNRLDPITDGAVTLVVTTHAFAVFTSALKTKAEISREFYVNYATIDNILSVNYNPESKNINRLFSVYLVLSTLKLIFAPISYAFTYGAGTLSFLNLAFAFYFVDLNLLNVLLKIAVLANRFKKFEEELNNELKDRDCFGGKWMFPEKVARFKLCYQLLFKQMYILTETHGFQIFLSCLYILFSSTTYIFLIELTEIGMTFAMTLELFVSSVLLTHIACVTERVIAARTHVILLLEDCLVERPMENKGPLELLSQVRRQPMTFSVWGLFNLNYQMLQTMVSITVSYTIILTQLSK